MKMPIVLAALVLSSAALANEPVIPDEAMKIRALKLGYILNGESMVRPPHLGAIDVTGLLYEAPPPLVLVPQSAPPMAKGN